MTNPTAPTPQRCPCCKQPSRVSQAPCRACHSLLGRRTAALMARAHSDPAFATAFLGQLAPSPRRALQHALCRSWLFGGRPAESAAKA